MLPNPNSQYTTRILNISCCCINTVTGITVHSKALFLLALLLRRISPVQDNQTGLSYLIIYFKVVLFLNYADEFAKIILMVLFGGYLPSAHCYYPPPRGKLGLIFI